MCLNSLKDQEIRERFQRTVEENISMDPPEEVKTDVNENWNQLKTILNKATTQTLKKRKRKDKVWFDPQCERQVEERKLARGLWLDNMYNEDRKQEYFRIRRETQILLRQKKREYYNDILDQAEDDFVHHRARQMYQNLKKATKGYKRKERFVKDIHGNILTNEEHVANRWKEYFSNLLSASDPENTFEFQFPDTVEPECPPPTLQDIQEIVNSLKNNKACGEDQIHAEIVKCGGIELMTRIKFLIDMIWEQEKMPLD